MRSKTRKAFTMIEMLMVVLMLSIFSSVFYLSYPNNDYEHYYFMDDYLVTQSEAMADNRDYLFENNYNYKGSFPIRFTKNGRVNNAQSLMFERAKVIIRLGNGNLKYE